MFHLSVKGTISLFVNMKIWYANPAATVASAQCRLFCFQDVEKVLSSSLNPSWSEGYTCTWISPDHDDLTYDTKTCISSHHFSGCDVA